MIQMGFSISAGCNFPRRGKVSYTVRLNRTRLGLGQHIISFNGWLRPKILVKNCTRRLNLNLMHVYICKLGKLGCELLEILIVIMFIINRNA